MRPSLHEAFRTWAAAVLFPLFFSGCLDQGPDTPPDVRSLADYATCVLHYPTGEPVDCSRDIAIQAESQVPAGYSCIDELPPPTSSGRENIARLWTDYSGAYGVQLTLKLHPTDEKVRSRIRLSVDGNEQIVDVESSDEGFVRLGPVNPNGEGGSWRVESHGFFVTGEPPILSQGDLEIRTTEFQENAWHIWSIAAADVRYNFESMVLLSAGSARQWVPGSFDVTGADFHLAGTATNKLNGYSEFVLPSPIERLTGAQRCSA